MKKNGFSLIKLAFSLVEMLVVLITVSIIMAAMTPIITKKIGANGAILKSGGGLITTKCNHFDSGCRLCDKMQCFICSKSCEGEYSLNESNCSCFSCAEKFGSNCETCNDTKCTKCDSPYYILNGNCIICPTQNYCNGVSKIVCENGKYQNETGKTSCKDCPVGYECTNGEKKGCDAGKYSIGNASSCTECEKGYKCIGSSDRILCSNGKEYQNETGKSNCKECLAGNYVSNDRKECITCEAGYKCVGDGTRVACTGNLYQPNIGQSSCLTCPSGYTCDGTSAQLTTCASGTYLSGDNCISCASSYGGNCMACNSSGCSACASGYSVSGGGCVSDTPTCSSTQYLSGNSCYACSDKFENCTKCTSSACSECEEGYSLKNGACEAEKNLSCGEGFDDSLFMRVNVGSYDICVTKRNMGDVVTLSIPTGITVVTAGSGNSCGSASDYTSLCCWNGPTADQTACDSTNGGYSGCSRTVCNWNAAKKICDSFNYKNKTWRLLSRDELTALDTEAYSINRGSVGLMLCDNGGGYGSARCHNVYNCLGCHGNDCHPYELWSGTEYDSTNAYYGYLNGGSWYARNNKWVKTRAYSVRCGFQL